MVIAASNNDINRKNAGTNRKSNNEKNLEKNKKKNCRSIQSIKISKLYVRWQGDSCVGQTSIQKRNFFKYQHKIMSEEPRKKWLYAAE